MSQTGFYLLFIPGLAMVSVAAGFTFAAFATRQGEFHSTTRRGLLSLVIILAVAAVIGVMAYHLDHLNLPPRTG